MTQHDFPARANEHDTSDSVTDDFEVIATPAETASFAAASTPTMIATPADTASMSTFSTSTMMVTPAETASVSAVSASASAAAAAAAAATSDATNAAATDKPLVQLHPLPTGDGVIVSVKPPAGRARVSCDVVLMIDVSGSMAEKAPAPDNAAGETEVDGLTVLDLTKQAARAIIQTLDEGDRLGVVTFTDTATVVLELTVMTPANKEHAWNLLKGIRPLGLTNLWHGILQGKGLLESQPRKGAMPALLLLTDGVPNRGCPPQGYIPRLRDYTLPAPISAFGFGYEIGSCLLQSIAEVTGGTFAFISDASMLATVFIHAIAHLQSTFAATAQLTVSADSGLGLRETIGPYVRRDTGPARDNVLHLPLGSLQFSQSRDIYLTYTNPPKAGHPARISARLEYQPVAGDAVTLTAHCTTADAAALDSAEQRFHQHRSAMCAFISGLAPLRDTNGQRKMDCGNQQATLQALIARIERAPQPNAGSTALLADLTDQVSLALSDNYIDSWGFHYLLSLYNAHLRQQCTSFKDPGPQQYNAHSALFQAFKRTLSDLFDTLPPPRPTVTVRDARGYTHKVALRMHRYNSSSNPCFAAEVPVRLASGATVPVGSLRPGVWLATPAGPRRLAACVATRLRAPAVLCRIGNLRITPWHPVHCADKWVFPAHVADSPEWYDGELVSLLLEPDADPDAHAVEVGGVRAVTLGHGAAAGVRAHAFWADYQRISDSLARLPVRDGVLLADGVERDAEGVVCGFAPRQEADVLLGGGETLQTAVACM